MYLYNTNPLKADSDGDGIIDSVEIANGSDPSNPNQDSDNDGFSNAASNRNQPLKQFSVCPVMGIPRRNKPS